MAVGAKALPVLRGVVRTITIDVMNVYLVGMYRPKAAALAGVFLERQAATFLR